jgi:hypothetical protein
LFGEKVEEEKVNPIDKYLKVYKNRVDYENSLLGDSFLDCQEERVLQLPWSQVDVSFFH